MSVALIIGIATVVLLLVAWAFAVALCRAAARGDRDMERYFEELHRRDG